MHAVGRLAAGCREVDGTAACFVVGRLQVALGQEAPQDVKHDSCLAGAGPARDDEVFALPTDYGLRLFRIQFERKNLPALLVRGDACNLFLDAFDIRLARQFVAAVLEERAGVFLDEDFCPKKPVEVQVGKFARDACQYERGGYGAFADFACLESRNDACKFAGAVVENVLYARTDNLFKIVNVGGGSGRVAGSFLQEEQSVPLARPAF